MKWNSLTYQQKLRTLIAGSIVMLIFCYQYGFKNTWNIYSEYQQNKTRTEQVNNYLSTVPYLKTEEEVVNDIIKKNFADTINSDRLTLAFITSFCKTNNLLLTDYQPMQIVENNNFDIATRQIAVEGSYIYLLKLLFEIENVQSYGRLCSVLFKGTEDISTGNVILKCTFYLQNLITKRG